MKRSERRLLEEKLRYVAMEDIELDPERERQILENAKAKSMRQGPEMATHKTSGGQRMGRRVLIVSAAAVLIMALSFGFAVLMPESVSHARGFVRTAAIWVNDTLHLGYAFEEPTLTPAPYDGGDATYATLEEAAANIPYPLFYLDDPSLTLRSVSIQRTAIGFIVSISYGDESEYCRIELTPVNEENVTDLLESSQLLIPWQYGELASWEGSSVQNAITYYSDFEVIVRGFNISDDDFLALCHTLRVFN